jgi:glutamate N-acetyltransferase / amino-acid N-acetyltransferase
MTAAPGHQEEEATVMDPSTFDPVLTPGGVTSPRGYRASGVHCGLKHRKPDLALVVSDTPATAAGMFTTNLVRAAPVRYCQDALAHGTVRAIVVNSGNANACTGPQGDADALEMAERVATLLAVPTHEVLVASTGVIGQALPMGRIRAGIPAAVAALDPSGGAAHEAILTTDAFPKTCAARFDLGGTPVTIGGMAKGAGMIHPNMATMLAFLTTDAAVAPAALAQALRQAVAVSFNSITVDGDTSTNDSVILLANGAAGGPALAGGAELERFTAALTAVCQDLARKIVRDGEGATRLVEVTVTGAASDADARRAAETVATSLLVKTMLWGGEPNWGRVLGALGRCGVPLVPETVDVRFGPVTVVRGGLGVPGVADAAAAALRGAEVDLGISLGGGSGRATMWTCDLNEGYVRINGNYLT